MTAALPLTGELVQDWLAAQPPQWRRRLAPVVAWVVLIGFVVAYEKEGGCSTAAPCGPDWPGAALFALTLAAPLLLLWVPVLGAGAMLVAVALLVPLELATGSTPRAVVALVVAAVLGSLAELWWEYRRRAAVAAGLAARAPTAPWPGPVPPLRVPPGVGVGLLLGVTALVVLGYGVWHGHQEAAAEATAERVSAQVVAHGDDGYLITVVVDDQRIELDTLLAADYPIGSSQSLLRGETFDRLVAEPYDPSGYLAGSVALLLLGAALGLRAHRLRTGTRALLTLPQPQFAVRLGVGDRTVVLAHDDESGVGPPLLSVDLLDLLHEEDEEDESGDDQEQARHRPGTEPAVLHGRPLAGSVVAAVLADGTGLLPLGCARRPVADWATRILDLEDEDEDEYVDVDVDEVVEVGQELTDRPTAAEPWQASPWRRPAGSVLLLGALVGAFFVARDAEGVFTTLWRLLIAGQFAFDGLVLLTTGVMVTGEVLVHHGPTTVRTFPLRGLIGASVLDDVVAVRTVAGDLVPLPWLPGRWSWWRRSAGREHAHEIARLLQRRIHEARDLPGFVHPNDLRPIDQASLAALAATSALVVAVLAGLYVRGAL